MPEIGQMKLETLSTQQLRLLVGNLRRRGQDRLASQVERELKRRASAGPTGVGIAAFDDDDDRPVRGGRRLAIAAGATGAALAVAAALIVAPRLAQQDPQAPSAVTAEAPRPRAMAALTPKPSAAPEPLSEDRAPEPTPTAPRTAEPRPRAGEPATLARLPEAQPPVQLAEAPPVPDEPETPRTETAPPASGLIAVSRAPALVAAGCDAAAGGASGLICSDARRAALSGGQSRGAPIPMRVAVTPPAAARLAARR